MLDFSHGRTKVGCWRSLLVSSALLATGCSDDDAFYDTTPLTIPSQKELTSGDVELVDAFGDLEFDTPVNLVEAGNRFYVIERAGKIWTFDRDAKEKSLFLDLSDHTMGFWDSGLLGLAMHPEFGQEDSENRGHFYVYYAHTDGEVPEPPEGEMNPSSRLVSYARLSRFTVPDGSSKADPESEVILIEQLDHHLWHQGGGLFFHPRDGFLYMSIGDEGGDNCLYLTCQHIDQALFGGVLRIDVDQRGGDISHPIPRQPDEGTTDHYYIPNDNPFVGQPDVLEEFYAIGLRNPYRMTHDPGDGFTWLADVGQGGQEEIDVLAPGANFQWNLLEGDIPSEDPRDTVRLNLGVWTDPVWAYERPTFRAIIGGYVYRGSELPSLYGKYIHGDFRGGTVWASPYEVVEGQVVITDPELILETPYQQFETGITSFGVDSNQTLYLLHYGDGARIQRFQARTTGNDAPRYLSETNLFQDLETLTPSEHLVPYSVTTPLWSDGAIKRRFIAVPRGQRVRVEKTGEFGIPPGTLLVKHFSMALDERKPDVLTRIETRVLVVGKDGAYGMTYAWDADGEDAELLREHREVTLTITDADGEPRKQRYVMPSPSECSRCHDGGANGVLGFNPPQIKKPGDDTDQLERLVDADVLSISEDDTKRIPKFVSVDDESAPLELRVRSYLDANCSSCHGTRRLGQAEWDARIETPLEDAKIVDAEPLNARGDLRIIAPGDPEDSLMLQRVSSKNHSQRMPPLASLRPDDRFVSLLTEWIESLDDEASDDAED